MAIPWGEPSILLEDWTADLGLCPDKLSSCCSPSLEKFGVRTEFAIVLQLSDYNEPVVKIMPLEDILQQFY